MPTALLLGEAACLGAALLWAVSVVMFRRPVADWGPATVNLAKCLLATVLLVVTAAAGGSLSRLSSAPLASLGMLALSGLVGLSVGDTALFAAVDRIGVHRTMLLQTVAPVFTALVAAATTGQWLSLRQLVAGVTTLAGVAVVVAPRPGGRDRPGAVTREPGWGIAFALLAALGQGVGVVLSQVGMRDVPVVSATLVRLAVACAGLLVVAVVRRDLGAMARMARDRVTVVHVLPAALLGTYAAMLLMMLGVELTPAALAAVLLATTPVFTLLLEAAMGRRLPSLAGVLGTLLAVAGVALLVQGG